MADRDILIKGAEEILSYVLPDEKDTLGIMVKVGWVRDVLSLLKEQEAKPVELHTNAYGTRFYFCPKCKRELFHTRNLNFCEKCGMAVKWDV